MKALAGDLKGARFALWKNPEDLTEKQNAKLSWVQVTNKRLYRAYLLKEQLRLVFKLRGEAGIALLTAWLAWASRSKIPAFVSLAKSIRVPEGDRSRAQQRTDERPGRKRQYEDPPP